MALALDGTDSDGGAGSVLPVLSDYDICLWNGENKCGHDAFGTVYFLWLVYADAAGEPGAYGVDADRAWGEYRVGRRIAASDELVAAISAGFHAGDGGGNRIYRGGILHLYAV